MIGSSFRRTAPDMFSPRAKTHNYLNLIMADQEVSAQDPEAYALLLDHNGNVSEGRGSNVFFVAEGRLMTPRERYVLPGVSRATVIEDRKSVVEGKGVAVRVALGGRRIIKKKKIQNL